MVLLMNTDILIEASLHCPCQPLTPVETVLVIATGLLALVLVGTLAACFFLSFVDWLKEQIADWWDHNG